MSGNDIIVLDSILTQKREDAGTSLSESDYFEIFSFEQALKNYDLSYDELLSGSVDNGDDGGIDGFFVFLNKDFLDEDADLSGVKKNPLLEIYLIQAKISASFSEKAIEALIATIQDLFDLSKDISAIEKFYNSRVIEKTEILRKSYVSLANRHPTIAVKYVYASKGNSSDVHPKVINKIGTLKQLTEKYFTGASVEFLFLGARELLESSRLEKSYSLQLKFLESYISRGEDNYVVLASLRDYYDFVTDENDILCKYLFESNVRDYQGDVAVNRDIRRTLDSDKSNVDFWWLNNGITILASEASVAGKVITLDDVQIVNGLQTTNTLYEYLKTIEPESSKADSKPSFVRVQDERAILIKIIVTNDLEARDRIIKATNFQTPVPAASLRATEPIQRDIEDYFLQHGWFYDRRKNYYKNVGKSPDKIISIPYLAQALTAIIHREPHNSKGRPTTIIKGDSNYNRIFNNSTKIEIYLLCSKVLKASETFIRSSHFSQLKDAINHPYLNVVTLRSLIFHYAMLFTVKILRKTDYRLKDIESMIAVDFFDENILAQTACEMADLTAEYISANASLSINTIAKREDFVTYLLQKINVYPSCIVKLSI
jgi:hypothetical protein